MHLPFTIPKPCHEDWNAMQPNEQGRHCLSCTKTVMDFTNWEVGDIKRYLENQTGERVCGRFRTQDLQPQQQQDTQTIVREIWASALPGLKKIAAVICLMFGMFFTSCNQDDAGKHTTKDIATTGIVLAPPLPDSNSHMSGEVALLTDTTTPKKIAKHKRVKKAVMVETVTPYPEVTMGVPPWTPEPPQVPHIAVPDTVKK